MPAYSEAALGKARVATVPLVHRIVDAGCSCVNEHGSHEEGIAMSNRRPVSACLTHLLWVADFSIWSLPLPNLRAVGT
jgi:hypothetical protein